MEDLHELLARDRLALDQELGDLVQGAAVLEQQPLGLRVGLLQDAHDLLVHLRGRLVAAVHDHLSVVQILVCPALQSHQAEFLGHAVLGDHGAGQPGCLLDVVCRAGRDRVKDDLLRRASGHELNEHGADLFLRVQVFLFLRHVQHIAQGAHGAGHDGDLLHRLGVLLQGAHEGVAHFVVGNDPALLGAQDAVLLLLADQHQLDRLEQISLGHDAAALLDGKDGRLVDHVRQVRAHGTGGGQGDRLEVDGLIHAHVSGVHAQHVLPALQVRLVHDHAPVKTAGTQERLVKDLGTVGGRQDEEAAGGIKAIHLCKQLVEGLLALVVAAAEPAVAVFADGIDLIDKDNAGGVLLRLVKQVADAGCADADEHLDELRTGEGEEGALRFAGHGFGQQGLARSGRAHQQRALGQLCADLRIFARVLQEVHDLLQGLLRFVLPGHIREGNARLLLDVHLGAALAHAHHAAAAGHPPHDDAQDDPDQDERREGKHHIQDEAGRRVRNLLRELDAGFLEPADQIPVLHFSRVACIVAVLDGLAGKGLGLRHDLELVAAEGDRLHLAGFHHLQKTIVGDLLGRRVLEHVVEQAHDHEGHQGDDQEDHDRGIIAGGTAAGTVRALVVVSVVVIHGILPLYQNTPNYM